MSKRFPDLIEAVSHKQAKLASREAGRKAAAAREAALAQWAKDFESRWGVKHTNIADATPTLTGGEYKKWVPGVSERYKQLVIRKGKVVEEIFRRGKNGATAFVDQLTFVLNKATMANLFGEESLAHEVDYINNFNVFLYEIFGFACSHNREKSANFYSSSYNLGDYENSYGVVCIGGGMNVSNADTICVEITATGLNAASEGWEQRLYDFSMLREVIDFRYTRVDVAHDYLDGSVSVDDVYSWWQSDGFTCSVQRPKVRKEGDDWENRTQNGRTLYVGSRMASKLFRAYEKGKQLGVKESPWVRLELEFRNRDLIIPKDIILHAGDYMSTAYPCLVDLFKTETPRRTVIKQRVIQTGIEHVIKYLRMQGSKAVNILRAFEKTDEEIMTIFNEDAGFPKRVHPGQYFAHMLNIDFVLHKLSQPTEHEALEPCPAH